MFNPFIWLDGILLGAAQKFCDKFQRVTGYTKFRLEKWSLILIVVFHWACAVIRVDSFLFLLLLIFTSGCVVTVHITERQEVEFQKTGKLRQAFFNTMQARLVVTLFMGCFAILGITSADFSLYVLSYGQASYILWVYFGACIPRPPSKSKMREWYEKGLSSLNDWLKPEPALIPISVSNR